MYEPRLEPIDDPDDPRLVDYRELKEHRLREESGKLVAESERVVQKLLASSLTVHSVLLTPTRLASLKTSLCGTYPVYVASQAVLDTIVGFHFHRGCLAVAARPSAATIPPGARCVVVLEDLVDVDNLGTMVRNAAAFGADAVLLSPRCADPFYRKAIRTSTGHVFFVPIVRAQSWPTALVELKRRMRLLGTSLSPRAKPLAHLQAPAQVAVLFGSEGNGLSEAAAALCDELITVPMAPPADSLNVSAAGAVVLYQLAFLQGRLQGGS